jgi:hypothetical protein
MAHSLVNLVLCCRTESGNSLLLPKTAQDLLMNMSIGSVDMSIPNMYHYLPHLIGKPGALKPAIKLSKGRVGGKFMPCLFSDKRLSVKPVSELL